MQSTTAIFCSVFGFLGSHRVAAKAKLITVQIRFIVSVKNANEVCIEN